MSGLWTRTLRALAALGVAAGGCCHAPVPPGCNPYAPAVACSTPATPALQAHQLSSEELWGDYCTEKIACARELGARRSQSGPSAYRVCVERMMQSSSEPVPAQAGEQPAFGPPLPFTGTQPYRPKATAATEPQPQAETLPTPSALPRQEKTTPAALPVRMPRKGPEVVDNKPAIPAPLAPLPPEQPAQSAEPKKDKQKEGSPAIPKNELPNDAPRPPQAEPSARPPRNELPPASPQDQKPAVETSGDLKFLDGAK